MTAKKALYLELINLDMKEPETVQTEGFELSYVIKRKAGEKHTEDSAGVFMSGSSTLVIGIADGFGGQNSGELASKAAIEELGTCLRHKKPVDIRARILDAFDRANHRILEELPGAATTLVVAEVTKECVRFYNAGDSAGYLFGGGGKEKFQTVQHNPVGLGIESGLVQGGEKKLEDIKHFVSNYLGSRELRIEISKIDNLKPRDKILLMSDGVIDNSESGPESSQQSVAEICTNLSEQASKKMRDDKTGKPDDMALIVVSFRI